MNQVESDLRLVGIILKRFQVGIYSAETAKRLIIEVLDGREIPEEPRYPSFGSPHE